MKTFTDTAGRTWEVTVDVNAIRRVRDLLDFNLLSIVEPDNDLAERLAEDVVLAADVLFAVVKPQADQRQVSDTDFGKSLSGDVIDAGTTALLEEVINFSPSRRRAILRRVLEKVTVLLDRMGQQAEQEATAILADPKTDARLMARLSGGSVGNSPASSESTPAG